MTSLSLMPRTLRLFSLGRSIPTILAALTVVALLPGCSRSLDTVTLVRNGRVTSKEASSSFIPRTVALLESCSVNSTAYVRGNTWSELLSSDSFAHITFNRPHSAQVMMQTGAPRRPQPLLVNEIIVPLPIGKWPGHIYVKAGTNVFAFTKYDPLALKKIACEPALGLSNSEPYASLAKMNQWTLRRWLRDVRTFLKRDN